jgi:hypothetical protein
MSELNPNAKLWVDALRSGKYTQGKNVLTEIKDGADYDCCLGVACKVYADSGLSLIIDVRPVGEMRRVRTYQNSYKILPEEVMQWLGLTTGDGRYGATDAVLSHRYLTDDNDGGKSFEQIAAIIESKPSGLFLEGK